MIAIDKFKKFYFNLKKILSIGFLAYLIFSNFSISEAQENVTDSSSASFPSVVTSLKEDINHRGTYTYQTLLSLRLLQPLISTNSTDPMVLLPFLLGKNIESLIEKTMGNSWIGSFFKGVNYLGSVSLLAYFSIQDPYNTAITLGASYLADAVVTLFTRNGWVNNKEILGALLFILEESGRNIGYEFKSQLTPKSATNISNLSGKTDFLEEMASGGFQQIVLDFHKNGTCPSLTAPLSYREDVPWLFDCEALLKQKTISSFPLELCPVFQEGIRELSPKAAKTLIDAFTSLKSQEKLGIIVGEQHDHMSDFLLETILMRLARAMGIINFLVEVPPAQLAHVISLAQAAPSESDWLIIRKIRLALSLGMKVTAIDYSKRGASLSGSSTCDIMEEIFNENREAAMCHNTLKLGDNFIAFLGQMHPSYFSNHCEGINNNFKILYLYLRRNIPSQEKRNAALEIFEQCKSFVGIRYKEFLSVLDNREGNFLVAKASLQNPKILEELLIRGFIKVDELPEKLLEN